MKVTCNPPPPLTLSLSLELTVEEVKQLRKDLSFISDAFHHQASADVPTTYQLISEILDKVSRVTRQHF